MLMLPKMFSLQQMWSFASLSHSYVADTRFVTLNMAWEWYNLGILGVFHCDFTLVGGQTVQKALLCSYLSFERQREHIWFSFEWFMLRKLSTHMALWFVNQHRSRGLCLSNWICSTACSTLNKASKISSGWLLLRPNHFNSVTILAASLIDTTALFSSFASAISLPSTSSPSSPMETRSLLFRLTVLPNLDHRSLYN